MEDQRSTCILGRCSGILVNDLCFLAPRAIQRTVATGGTIKSGGAFIDHSYSSPPCPLPHRTSQRWTVPTLSITTYGVPFNLWALAYTEWISSGSSPSSRSGATPRRITLFFPVRESVNISASVPPSPYVDHEPACF